MCSTFDLMSLVLVLPDFLVCFISYCDLTYDLAHLSMTLKSVVGGWVSQWVNEARGVVDATPRLESLEAAGLTNIQRLGILTQFCTQSQNFAKSPLCLAELGF